MSESRYDVAVIGGGIGGYVSAIRSSQLGKKVILIEKHKLGGTCLNWGCIPTKALLTTAKLLSKFNRSEEFGILVDHVKLDFVKAMERKDSIVKRLTEGIRFLIKKNKVRLVEGKGFLLSSNHILIQKSEKETETIEAENIILATGSEAPNPSFTKIDEVLILTNKGALSLKKLPETISIIGGDAIGVEFAQIFNDMGSKVILIEMGPNLLPSIDRAIGRTYQRILKKKGVEIHLNVNIESVKVTSNTRVETAFTKKDSNIKIQSEKALISGRRRPLSTNLGLEKIGIHTENGFIKVDESMRTNIRNIFAVGDVTGGHMLAHIALAEGILAAEIIAGLKSTINRKVVPTCVYAYPEAASIGLSEEEAKERGYKVSVGKVPLFGNGKALTMGETDGFAKVVCDMETGEILGVHLLAPNATDIIGEAALGMQLECTYDEIGELAHSHPTISEALMEAARAVAKKAIHI